jgi:hypothetical protein
VSVEFTDVTASGFAPGHQDAQSNNTTSVTILSAPASSTYRLVRSISVYQKDTADVLVTVKFDNGGTDRELVTCILSPGDTLTWSMERGWQVMRETDTLREPGEATDTKRGIIELATAGDMREGNNNTMVVVPGRVPYHLSVCNCWGKASGDGTTLNASFNVTSVTDTNTGRLGVNIATDFIEPQYAIHCTLIRGVTTYAVADVEDNNIRFDSQRVGSFEIESYDHTATTMVADDPASYFWQTYGHWLP